MNKNRLKVIYDECFESADVTALIEALEDAIAELRTLAYTPKMLYLDLHIDMQVDPTENPAVIWLDEAGLADAAAPDEA